MPTVPRYDSPQVQEQALPSVRQESVASPALFDAGGAQLEKFGKSTVEASADISKIVLKLAHENDLDQVQRASAQYQKAAQDFALGVRDKRMGAAAAGVVDEFDQWHKTTTSQITETLQNAQQKQAFAVAAGRSSLAVRHDLGAFQIQQGHIAFDDSFKADVKNTIGLGATAITPDASAVYRDQLLPKIAAYAAVKNFAPGSPEEIALRTGILTDFHTQRIQQLASSKPGDAAVYFEKNKDEIDGRQWAEVGKYAQHATARSLGDATAQIIWAEMGPTDANPVSKILDMEQRARRDLKGPVNEFALENALKNLKELDAAFKNQRAETSHAIAADATRVAMNGASGAALRNTPEFQKLFAADPKAAQQVDNYADAKAEHRENRAYTAIARANAEEERAQRQLARRGNAAYWEYSNPDTLTRMSENQITALAPSIGDQHVNALLEKKRSFVRSESKVIEARIDREDFNTVAQELKLRPFDPHKSEDEKAALGILQGAIENRINVEQQAKGNKELTRQEKMVIARQVMDNKVMEQHTFTFNKEIPAALLTRDTAPDAYVMVGSERVKLSSINPAFRKQAIADLTAAGKVASEAAIAKTWVLNRKTWKEPQAGVTGAY